MAGTTSVGSDDPNAAKQSGIDDEEREHEPRNTGQPGEEEVPGDLTREDIEAGNDRNASADQPARSGTTNKIHDDGIEFGK